MARGGRFEAGRAYRHYDQNRHGVHRIQVRRHRIQRTPKRGALSRTRETDQVEGKTRIAQEINREGEGGKHADHEIERNIAKGKIRNRASFGAREKGI